MMGVANVEMFVECLSKTVIFVQKVYDFQIRLPKNTSWLHCWIYLLAVYFVNNIFFKIGPQNNKKDTGNELLTTNLPGLEYLRIFFQDDVGTFVG